jgi:hypothetical protein
MSKAAERAAFVLREAALAHNQQGPIRASGQVRLLHQGDCQ